MNQTDTKTVDHLPVVDAFLRYLLDERHFSPYTSRCYGVDLRQYVDFINEELNLSATTQQETDAFQRRRQAGAPRGQEPLPLGIATPVG